MTSEAIMPRGKSRCGLRVSSAAVETASKPMYEKKASEAPVQMPCKPLGAKGCQCAGLHEGSAHRDEADDQHQLEQHHARR